MKSFIPALLLGSLILLSCGSSSTTAPSATSESTLPSVDPPVTGDDESDDADKTPTVKIKLPVKDGEPVEFELEIAADERSRAIGLSGREEIDEHGGMLFVYPRAAHRGFWMWNCLVDIDVIYLDVKGAVTAMHEMAIELPRQAGESMDHYEGRLPRYRSLRPAQFAIELKSGWIEKLDLEKGDVVEFDREELVEMAKKAE